MRIVLFSVFGYNVYSHGVFLVLGMAIAGYLFYRLAKKENLPTNKFLLNFIASIVTGVIASRILFYFLNLKYYTNFYQIAEIWQGGMVSFAGFIFGGIVFLLLLRAQKENIAKWLDMAGIVFPLGIGISRVGCVLAGEVGRRYYGPFAYYYHYPITAMEIYLCLAIFAINFSLYLYARKYLIDYFLFFSFIALYSFFRIFIDSYRADPNLIIGINLSQLTSFIIFAISFFTFSIYYLKRKLRQK
ncbi:MAG: prolipoprotein diacylglyceryl transferase [Candidatus Berkelbacteria bacterium]|nr:prolipoprotein diacylglyceryl transferase [Candidatus Berkelbacteria bacterium]